MKQLRSVHLPRAWQPLAGMSGSDAVDGAAGLGRRRKLPFLLPQ
jgi:hypothetical protein